MTSTETRTLVGALRDAGEDFEWYPTTRAMVDAILIDLRRARIEDGDDPISRDRLGSILDIGAGDGRVLQWFAEAYPQADLFAIEKSALLLKAQPDTLTPVGTDFYEQDLMSLPADVVFCNPPYSEYEAWASRIIETAHADTLYLVLPQRWQASPHVASALDRRTATATVIHEGDFLDAERRARAVVHIVRVTFPGAGYRFSRQDPFDLWFDQHIDTFDREAPVTDYEQERRDLTRLHALDTVESLVAAFNEEYDRMQENYKAIFRLDYALLKELGVNKDAVRKGLKTRMGGLKATYWQALFNHLDAITSRLSTKTKNRLLEQLTGRRAVAFTASNAYAVVLWAIKQANQYFDVQLVDLFRELSTREGVRNYASNLRTWETDGWRYHAKDHSHYALDYRVVLPHYQAIQRDSFGTWEHPGGLHTSCHEVLDDCIAVFGNLGFVVRGVPSRLRVWASNQWQDFSGIDGAVVFQVKAYLNGNLHFRFRPEAIKALNIEAGRLLGWLRAPADVVTELRYSDADAQRFFGSNHRLDAHTVKCLTVPRGV